MIVLTWRETVCPIFGQRFELLGLKDDESCGANQCGGGYIASAFINGYYMSYWDRTIISAMIQLEKEIHKHSISLFGDDTVTFLNFPR